jgi:cytochrome P450
MHQEAQAVLGSPTETYPLTDPVFLEDPYPVYRRMRQHDPVYWSEALGHWVLTRYDDVVAAARNPALSSARTEVFVRAQLAGSYPAVFEDPEHFDIHRPNAREHLSFGQGRTIAWVRRWPAWRRGSCWRS